MNDSDTNIEYILLQEMGSQSTIVSHENVAEQQLATQTQETTPMQQKLSFLSRASTFIIIRFFYIAVILNAYIAIMEYVITKYMAGAVVWNDISTNVAYICSIAFISLLLLILTNAFLHIVSYKSYMPRWYEIAVEVTLFVTVASATYLYYDKTLKEFILFLYPCKNLVKHRTHLTQVILKQYSRSIRLTTSSLKASPLINHPV